METLKITSLGVVAFVASSPNPVGIFVSILFGFYILNMLYFNIVRKYFNGSWRAYINSFINRFKKN